MLRVWRTHHPCADFFFLADAFLDCASHEYKKTDEENEPSGLLFTSSLVAKSGLKVTPLCREATRCKHRYRARAPSRSTSTQESGKRSTPRGRVTECGAPVRRCALPHDHALCVHRKMARHDEHSGRTRT